MTFRVVIVAAVSTPTQARSDQASLPEQVRDCRAACEAHGWQVVETITIPGQSRDYLWLHEIIRESPEYAHLVQLIESGQVDVVVCRHYDRLWSNSSLQAQVSALCRHHRVQVYSVMQPKDPLPPETLPRRPGLQGIMESLSGILRDEEQNIRVARHNVGMEGRVRRGLHGASITPYGYLRGSGQQQPMIVDPTHAQWVRWMFERRAEGWGYVRIARELDDRGVPPPIRRRRWLDVTVRTLLRNSAYIGEARYGQFCNPQAAHEPIISRELWESARALDGTHFIRESPHLLTGLVVCGYCGWGMCYHPREGGRRYVLSCNLYSHSGGKECQCNSRSARLVEGFIHQEIRQALADPVAFAEAAASDEGEDYRAKLAGLDAQRQALSDRYQRWNELYESGGITAAELMAHRARLHGEVERLTSTSSALRAALARRESRAQRVIALGDILQHYDNLPPARLREVYTQLIAKIILKRGERPDIKWL
jgi:DNA invertase Pin-like site-specific DNA recombinase